MRSRKIGVVVTLIIMALAWLNYFEHEKLKSARKQIAQLSAKVHRLEALLEEARLPVIQDTPSTQASRIDQGREYQAAVEAFEKKIQDLEEPVQDLSQPESGPSQSELLAIEKMKKGGVLRTRHRAAARMLDNALGDLLSLPPDKAQTLEALLNERQAAANDYVIQLLSQDLTEAQRADLVEQASATVAPIDAAISQTLGEPLNAEYQEFEASRMARIQHNLAVLALKDAALALDVEQEEILLDLMAQKVLEYPSLTSIRSTMGFSGVLQDGGIAYQRQEDLLSYHEEIGELAEGILTPDQQAVFIANLELQREMQETGLALMTQTVPGAE